MGDLLKPASTSSIFDGMEVRREWHNDEWWFSIIDVVSILVGDLRPNKYRSDLKVDIMSQGYTEVSGKIGKLKMKSEKDGKSYPTDVANTEGLLRVIQSIPSPKAEPFKLWLAQLGQERVEEFNDPELGINRAKSRAIQAYKAKGLDEKEIQTRMQGIEIRGDFTKELQDRGIEGKGYGIITNIASYGRSDQTASEYKKTKGLSSNDNLRDHMTRPENLLTGLAEETTTRVMQNNNLHGFQEIQEAAHQGASVARKAKEEFEKSTGESVVSAENRLTERQKQNRQKLGVKKKKK